LKFFDRSILFINLIVVFATLLAYISPYIDPEFTWILSFFGLFYPLLLIANLLFIIYWIFKKPKYIVVSVVCILVGWSQLMGFFNINFSGDIEVSKDAFEVMTYNISNASYGYDKKKKDRDVKKAALKEFLGEYTDIEILCFQEVGDYALEILKATYPKYYFHNKDKGAVILSKYPFKDKGEIDFGTITNSCLWADVKLPKETVRIYSFHLQSNQISADAEKLAAQKEIDQKKAWYDIKGMLRKFRNHHLQRSHQVEKIAAHAEKSPYKLIMAGDLNDPPQSYTYSVLADIGNDAYKIAGSGIGTTYGGKLPLLRIDYIFCDKQFTVIDYVSINKNYSDHYPVISTIDWPSIELTE